MVVNRRRIIFQFQLPSPLQEAVTICDRVQLGHAHGKSGCMKYSYPCA
jgi:hypothetical protein